MEYKKNDICEVKIEDIGTEGEGIGKVDGFTIFVKDAVKGDKVLAGLTKVKKNYAYARLVEVLEPSPYRVTPPCPFYKACGGCQIQAMSINEQLKFKQEKVKNNLVRLGGFDEEFIDSIMEPIIGMENPFRYRNKAQYPIGVDKNNKPIAGFYAGRTHSIIANTDCLLGVEENKTILEIILKHMEDYGISAYDEEKGVGLMRHVLIRKGFTSKQIMICLVVNASKGKSIIPGMEKLVEKLLEVPNVKSISLSLNREKTNVIMGKEIITIAGEDRIEDTIHVRNMKEEGFPFTGESLTFNISPLSFYQVNPVQTEKLYSTALEYAGLTGNETVWDLYCGIGTISLFMAMRAKSVVGVEIVEAAINDAKENAQKNNITNARFLVGKAEEVVKTIEEKPDVIVVDPPRKGCDEECLKTMLEQSPKRIVYVSCDSATLARDLKYLVDGGYRLERVRAVDQFAQTVHVETVCLLSNRKADAKIRIDVDLEDYYAIKDAKKSQN